MVVCLFRAITFGYEKITIVHTVKTIRGRLVISIAGVRVWIIGGERKIEEFGRILSDRIASAKKRCSLQSAVAPGGKDARTEDRRKSEGARHYEPGWFADHCR